ncbi:MAG: response regulator transcription factor [Candidatus Aminicenantes bacterium]|nr:MAG: response regulator transcription factor [Candidatus Aminicenantes bacterium]
MLSCIIVDDESGAIEILTRYANQTPELRLVRSFRDSIEALTFLAGNEVDLVFLDIDMPNLDGMKLSELIRYKDIQVIFCTAYSEYAVESYEKEAIDYLLKPISYERFLKAVKKALKARSEGAELDQAVTHKKIGKSHKLFLKSGPRIHQVDTCEVLYIEKKGHYVVFHTPGGELLSRMNMKDLLNSLPYDDFIRIHRSFVVAIDKIDTIEKHMVVVNGRKIPIGESYRDDFFERIQYSGN